MGLLMLLRRTSKCRRGIDPLTLNLGARYRGVVSITPRPHYTLEINPVPTGQEAVWVPERVWTFWRREKYLAPVRSVQLDYTIPVRRKFRPI